MVISTGWKLGFFAVETKYQYVAVHDRVNVPENIPTSAKILYRST